MPTWYTDFADAVEAGEQYYLQCEACSATGLPPRSLCPACGTASLREQPLSNTATVVSFTEIHISTPKFADATPYTVIVADFDEDVQLTGQLRGAETVAIGETVVLGTERFGDESTILTFSPE